MAQQSTRTTDGVQQLQQQAVVQHRPTSSQSIAGPIAGERPPSRALPVTDTVEG